LAVGSTTFGAQASSANGTTPTTANTTPQNRNVITLEVTARQALQITTASKNGQLNLTLNPSTYNPGDFKVDSVDEIAAASNVFDQTLTRTDQMLAAIKAAHANK